MDDHRFLAHSDAFLDIRKSGPSQDDGQRGYEQKRSSAHDVAERRESVAADRARSMCNRSGIPPSTALAGLDHVAFMFGQQSSLRIRNSRRIQIQRMHTNTP